MNAGGARGFVHNVVKFGTGLFNGKRPINKMLLGVADRELDVRKSGNNPEGLFGTKGGLGRDERILKGLEYIKYEQQIQCNYNVTLRLVRATTVTA